MALRDLIVNIDFDGLDRDIQRLLHMNSAVDDIEDSLRRMGSRINDVTDATQDVGDGGSGAMDDLTDSTNDAEEAMDELGDTANTGRGALGMLATAGVAAGAAIVAAMGAAIVAIGHLVNESEQSFDRLQAQTGASNAAMVGLKETALNVYENGFGESLPAVAEDLGKLKNMFRDLDRESLETLTSGAYTISDLWGPEVAEVGKVVKTMTSNFKDLSEQQALDLMTTAFQKGGDYADDLLDTFNEYSVYFSKLGMDAQTFTGILVKGAEAGAFNMDKVADSVKEFGIRGMDGSKTTADGFKAIGLDATDMGKKIAVGGDSATKAFAATVAGLAAMDDKVAQNTAGVNLFGTQWEDVRDNVVFAMQDAEGAVSGFEGSTKRASKTASDNFGSKMTQIWRGLQVGIIDAFGGSDSVLTKFADKALQYMPQIKAGIQDFADFLGGVMDWAEGIYEKNSATIETYLDNYLNFIDGFVNMAKAFWDSFGNDITSLISNTFTVVYTIVGGAFQTLGDLFNLFGDIMKGDWGAVLTDLETLFINMGNNMLNSGRQTLNWIFALFGTTFDEIVLDLTGIDLASIGSNMIDGLINGMKSKFNTAIAEVKAFGANIEQSLIDFFDINSPSKRMADNVGQYLPSGVAVGINDNAQDAINAARNMGGEIAGAASIAPSGGAGGSTTNTIAPNVQIIIQAAQGNAQEVAVAVRAELAKLFGEMQPKFA